MAKGGDIQSEMLRFEQEISALSDDTSGGSRGASSSKSKETECVITAAPVLRKPIPEIPTKHTGGVIKKVAPGIELNIPAASIQQEKLCPVLPKDADQAAIEREIAAIMAREKRNRKKRYVRTAAGQTWEDKSLEAWDPDDFRIFCGDLGNEVTDEVLIRAFARYGSFVKAKVIRDKRSNKSKGYGFVSFRDPNDFMKAMREMNGKYVGNRPIKLRKSNWQDRQIEVVRKKDKEKKKLGLR